jgi:hypothetical protein
MPTRSRSTHGTSATTRNVHSLVAAGYKRTCQQLDHGCMGKQPERRRDALHLTLERSSSVAATLSLYPVNYANGCSQHNFP